MKATNFKTAILIFLMAISMPTYSSTISTDPVPGNRTEKTAEVVNGELLLKRLNEIKDMDKSDLSRAEKENLEKK